MNSVKTFRFNAQQGQEELVMTILRDGLGLEPTARRGKIWRHYPGACCQDCDPGSFWTVEGVAIRATLPGKMSKTWVNKVLKMSGVPGA